ncbi:hypothetical protein HYALB_00000052 [Hymenoscyphus albidus]|uniref:Autophagy-related protein 11 n=1 Tax=Hymenoscyphus albidus TaxID=595503 RepID=A0A9N9PYY6_9HELO|nr:hypothetical protein HYALB_00000052 [Hymenoscyphus albidus]
MRAWEDLFMARRTWALDVVKACTDMSNEAQKRYDELHVIARSIDTVIISYRKHVKTLDKQNNEFQTGTKELEDQRALATTNWPTILASLPATSALLRFITGDESRRIPINPTLADILEAEDCRKALEISQATIKSLNQNGPIVGRKVDVVMAKMDALQDKIVNELARKVPGHASDPAQLIEDIEALARKVNNDYESVLTFPKNSKGVSQASRSALLHTKNYLPNLAKRALEMDEILRSVTEARNAMAESSLGIMHDLYSITVLITEANSLFEKMDPNDNARHAIDMLNYINILPTTTASLMAEAVRRREWNEKVKSDSSTLAVEMSTFQEEEAKRRRKWQKNNGSRLWGDRSEHGVASLEVNLRGEEEEWPEVTRPDLEEFLENLKAHNSESQDVANVIKIIKDLNSPTKQQSKRAKAFKAGSMHEAALGRSTLLVRGDDDLIRVLQEEKQKVESQLKTSQSRVRRLEDVLHRQTQMSRAPTSNAFHISGIPSPDTHVTANPLASPHLIDDISRRSSVLSRRYSSHQNPDEKAMQQKLLSAEAEVIAEREKVAGLEREISARKTSAENLKSRMDEVNITKNDLFQNFEAQQREFIVERKSLEEDIKKYKATIEELENEIEHFMGSREHEKASVDEQVRMLQDELEKTRQSHIAESQKAQGQVDYLRNDAKLQRETNETLERQLQRARADNRELLSRVEHAESIVGEQFRVLQDIHLQLSPRSKKIPDDLPALAEVLVGLSGDLVAELKSVKSDATIARSDRDTAQSTILALKSEVDETRTKLQKEQTESARLNEALASGNAKFVALEAELANERGQLSTLRTKIADGETGSESLRNRLEEEERKVTTMSEDLATRQSRIGSLEEELRDSKEKYEFAQSKHEKLASRFEARTSRAKDLTQRVYMQNDRLCRLLERLSYSVTRDGGSMTIQRIPKPERSNANDSSDPGSSLRKSVSGAITRKSMVDSGDLDLLYWMNNDDSEVESEKYGAYLNAIGSFDVEAFCDVLTKRIKDIEYTAKKYSRDARSYRDKSHAAQSEAHEKIAFKHFKEGDLALFLPTRNQATRPWAAFNVGAPHYFLREQDSHKLRARDWLLARIHKIEERVVDLSKSMTASHNAADGKSIGGDSFEDDNPFELSDGLRWYLIDAAEEKPGAPSTPGLGKSTVASAHIDATGQIRKSKKSSTAGVEGINKTLSRSLDSRRSSVNSKKAIPIASTLIKTGSTATDTASLKAASTTSIQPPGETTDAQIIRPSSKHGPANGGETAAGNHSEVRNKLIDDLMSGYS